MRHISIVGSKLENVLLDHGLINAIVPRKELKPRLIEYLNSLMAGQKHVAVAG